jgi:predicted ATP-grasp superfamily ATP-dependent carboligase
VPNPRRRLADFIPRPDESLPGPNLDPDLPALVLWVTPFSLQHNCLGVFRTLGRAGVPVYALVGHPNAPVLRSRYVRGHILWQPYRGEGYAVLLTRLMEFGRQMGRRSLIICTTDEMAVWVARKRAVLEEWFVLPDVGPKLPAELTDKETLADICRRTGTPIPSGISIDTATQLDAVIDDIELPLIVKSTALRGQVQNVVDSTLVPDREALRELAARWSEPFQVLLQEYLPDEHCEDWFAVGYCDSDSRAELVFTGRKVRTWPAHGGALAAGYTAPDIELVALTRQFCGKVGYRGIFDMDWRLDRRTGRYYLLDFNPRVGAQFRMFEDSAGIDVVRAMHLDLSGRPIPVGSQIDGERFIIEAWDLANLVSQPRNPLAELGGEGRPWAAWLATDDMAPVIASAWTQLRQSVAVRARRFFQAPPL